MNKHRFKKKVTTLKDNTNTWKMISSDHFELSRNGLKGIVNGWTLGCRYWCIMKDDMMIDKVYQHNSNSGTSNSELSAKAMVEKRIKELSTVTQ
jgi:hypothetical protein